MVHDGLEVAVYREPGDKGPDVGEEATWWRLLGVRVTRSASHLEHTDLELFRGAYESVTAEDGELRRIVGVERVVRGRKCVPGAAPADEDTFAVGKALDEERRIPRPGGKRKRVRGYQEAVEGTLWVVGMLERLGGAVQSLPRRAWIVRPGDFSQEAYLKALMAGQTDAEARPAAWVDGAESAAFWGATARGEQ